MTFSQDFQSTSYGLPSGGSTAVGASGAVPMGSVLPVPASCVASGFSVTAFVAGGYSGATAPTPTATITLLQGTPAALQSGSLTATALTCSVSTASATATNVACSTAATAALTAGNVISLRVQLTPTFSPFSNGNMLVRFVCQ